jgi:hypothetical protein
MTSWLRACWWMGSPSEPLAPTWQLAAALQAVGHRLWQQMGCSEASWCCLCCQAGTLCSCSGASGAALWPAGAAALELALLALAALAASLPGQASSSWLQLSPSLMPCCSPALPAALLQDHARW